MDLRISADFSDVEGYFDDGMERVKSLMADTGEDAVEYAKEHGDYQNRTHTLRKSNKFKVSEDGLTLYNDATAPHGYQYAAKVESRGYDVLSSAALHAERKLKEKFER